MKRSKIKPTPSNTSTEFDNFKALAGKLIQVKPDELASQADSANETPKANTKSESPLSTKKLTR